MASTTSFKQQCPSCEAMVPIRDPGLIGRKIDCPKCKYRFVVEKPKGKAKDDGEDSSSSDTPAPTKKVKKPGAESTADTRVPGKKGLKSGAVAASGKGAAVKAKARPRDEDDEDEEDRPKKKKSGVSMTVILGASLGGVALVLLVIGGLAMSGVFSPKSTSPSNPSNPGGPSSGGTQPVTQSPGPGVKPGGNNPPAGAFIADVTNLLPNDADTVVNYQIDKLYESGLGQAALEPGAFSKTAFQDLFAFPLYAENNKGVERVVTAISNKDHWVFSVLHTQKGVTIDKDKLIANLQLDAHDAVNGLVAYSIKRDLDGLSTLLLKANRAHEDLQMVILDGQTLVFADPAPMQKFLADKGRPALKTQPAQVTPPANQNPMGGINPMPGGTGPGGTGPGGTGPMGGGTGPGGMGPMGGGLPMGGGTGPGGTGPMGGGTGPGGTGPMGGGTGGAPVNTGPSAAPPQLIGSYLTLEPGMKALFDRIEKSDQPILISAVVSSKDPMVDQFGRLVQGRAASWAASKDVSSDVVMRSLLDQVKVFRPQDVAANYWIGFGLTAFSSDKVNGMLVVDLGRDDVVKTYMPILQLFIAGANALLGSGTPDAQPNPGMNPGGMNPGGMNPGGTTGPSAPLIPFKPSTSGGAPQPGNTGPAGNPNGMNPGGMNPGGVINPGGTGGPNGMNPGGMNPGGMNPGGVDSGQPQGPLTLTQDKSMILLSASLVFVGDKSKKMDQEIGQLITRLKAGAETASSRSRIHELAAALQKYVQAKGHFPRGTADRGLTPERYVKWAPNERVSWMAELLPYLGDGEYANLRVAATRASWQDLDELNKDEDKKVHNLRTAGVMIPQFISHSDPSAAPLVRYPGVPLDVAVTNYVGVAGAGLDAADYPAGNPKDGIFGYERETKPDEVKDGLDKTIALLQIPAGKTPWLAGGGSTIRGVSEGPNALAQFVCADYQGRRGTFAVMGDFKVRFIPENIDPSKFTAMCTIAGGEKLDDIDAIAPVVPDDTVVVVKTAPPEKGPDAPAPDKPGDVPAGWQLVKSDDGFSAFVPEGEIKKLSGVDKSPAGDLPVNGMLILGKQPGTMFQTTAEDLSKLTLKPGEVDAILDNTAQSMMAALPPGSKITSQGKSMLGGNPAREVVVDLAGKATLKVRMAVLGTHLFALSAAAPDKDVQTFFDSFKLTAK